MLDTIRLLAKKMNVSGCEGALANEIYQQLLPFHPTIDPFGNVLITKEGCEKKKKKILLSCPMDVPGFLALFISQDKAYLSRTFALKNKHLAGGTIIGEDLRIHSLEKKIEEGDDIVIKKKEARLGDTFKPYSNLLIENGFLSGWFSGRYALLFILLSLAKSDYKNDVILSFTTSGATRCARERALCRRYAPDALILPCLVEDEGKDLLLVAKDGKAFSDDDLLTQAALICKNDQIGFRKVALDESVTKAEEVARFESTPFLSLALPCQKTLTESESTPINTIDTLKNLIYQLLNV